MNTFEILFEGFDVDNPDTWDHNRITIQTHSITNAKHFVRCFMPHLNIIDSYDIDSEMDPDIVVNMQLGL